MLRDRLRAYLNFVRPRLIASGADLDRLSQLRRLSDVRLRAFIIGKPRVTGLEVCELLADPKSGRFDALAGGLLRRADLEAGLEPLGEDMGALVEACLQLQVLGSTSTESLIKEAVVSLGALPDAPSVTNVKGMAAPSSPAARPLAGAKELWTAPAAPLRAMKLLEEKDPQPDKVAAEIEKDPGFGSRFLRIASAIGGARIPSVSRAVVTLGFPVTRRVVGVSTLVPKIGTDEAFWSHALRGAFAASLASKAAKVGNPDEHWISGLLHECGTPLKARYAPDADVPPGEIGAFVLERWKFPAGVFGAARHHADSIETLEDASLPRDAMVAVACCRLVRGEGGRWLSLLRLTPAQAADVAAESERRAKALLPEFLLL